MRKIFVVYIVVFLVLLGIFAGFQRGVGCIDDFICHEPGYETKILGIRLHYTSTVDLDVNWSCEKEQQFGFPFVYYSKYGSFCISDVDPYTTEYNFSFAAINFITAALLAYLVVLMVKYLKLRKKPV